MKNKTSLSALLAVLFGFFIMGFCDVVGMATSYVKNDFGLSETLAGFIPSAVFFWFLLLSVPTAIVMNKIGRKRTVLVSMVITIVGMMLPFISYNLVSCMVAFAFLGIGNTILQVSLNPLLTNVVKGDALTSSLTGGQVIKAISSFCGPFIAAFALSFFGSWEYLFPIFAVITLISTLWLLVSPIQEEKPDSASSFGATFGLLKDKTILLLFLGIVFVVGTDVGMNTIAPKLLIERRTGGAFVGTALLAKYSPVKFFRINILIAILGMLALFFVNDLMLIYTMIGLVGFVCSSIFSVIYSMALQSRPDKANEISGLMITGVFGGASERICRSYFGLHIISDILFFRH